MEIRPATPADDDGIGRLHILAFGPEGVRIVRLLGALDAATRASYVADDGRVVGHLQLSRGWVDNRERLVEVGILSPLAVDETHRGRGLARALVERAVERAGELGLPAVFLEGAPGLYAGLGFTAARDHGVERPSERIPHQACQVRCTGVGALPPGRLVYPEAFWLTDTVGLRDPQLGEVESYLS